MPAAVETLPTLAGRNYTAYKPSSAAGSLPVERTACHLAPFHAEAVGLGRVSQRLACRFHFVHAWHETRHRSRYFLPCEHLGRGALVLEPDVLGPHPEKLWVVHEQANRHQH